MKTRFFGSNIFAAALPMLTLCVAALSLNGCANDDISRAEKTDKDKPSGAEVKATAEEGFIYGLPLVMNYAVNYEFFIAKNSPQHKSTFNEIHNEHSVFTYKDTAVVTPNSDTPYSFASFDLRSEPIVIFVPAVEKSRYYSVQFIDWNTFNVGYVGSRATGNDPGDYLLAGPDWNGPTPPGIKGVIHSTTQFSIALFRTQLFGPDDMPNVETIQAGYKAQPLSAYLHQPAPAAPPAIDFPVITPEMVKTNFFEYLDFALQFAPPGPEEESIRAKLARIGVGPGKQFDFKELSLLHKLDLAEGMKAGEKKVEERAAALGKKYNGWQIGSAFGDRNFFHGDWLLRAAAAKAGIYGNDAVEALYPMTRTDDAGNLLDGTQHNYTMTFPAGELPPVYAFWSITMYDGKTQLLIQNPIDRYLINSPMLPNLKKNGDGSLTIYIQNASPGLDKQSNWLPAPSDTIYLVMRLYAPQPEALTGKWNPPPVKRAD